MTARALAIAASVLIGSGAAAGPGRPGAPTAGPSLIPKELAHQGKTRCSACHTPEGWEIARFMHERTGFPLRGRHAKATCTACHARSFDAALPHDCAGCHGDPHRGELGARCESCHSEERDWRTTFGGDAHRRTNFPLIGRHAALPCSECHAQSADRRFSGVAVGCASCHQRDYARTAATPLNHAAIGFSTDCVSCHDAWRFQGARFPGHEACFTITRSHLGISCTGCHSVIPAPAVIGTCSSGTAACTACHSHSCAQTDREHGDVAGYQCKDRKCYECHRFSGSR